MKKTNSIILVCIFFGFGFGHLCAQNIKVSTVKELLNQIGSNKTIELAADTFNFTEIAGDNTNPNVSWSSNTDGYQPDISSVNNLKIIGNGKAVIVIQPRYVWVMNFENCNDISLSGVIFGHTEAGYCENGVLGFNSCSNVSVSECSLYGSGTVGFRLFKCSNVSFMDCDIHDCTYGLAEILSSNNVKIDKTTFRKTGEYNLIWISDCNGIDFANCTFSENFNGSFFPYFFSIDTDMFGGKTNANSKNLKIEKCVFKDNKVQEFSNDVKKLKLLDNEFSGNTFDKPR